MPPSTAALRSLAGILAFAPACEKKCEKLPPSPSTATTGRGEAPRLVDGTFVAGDVVELAFSEALAPVDAVDPEKFRLGIVTLTSETYRGRCTKNVGYCDPTTPIDDEYGCGYSYYSYGGGSDTLTRVTALELDDDDPTRLRLRFAPALDRAVCLRLDYADFPAGIHVFFSAADLPTIEDRDGEALSDIAPHWVLFGESTTSREDFEGLDHWMPIPCPEHF